MNRRDFFRYCAGAAVAAGNARLDEGELKITGVRIVRRSVQHFTVGIATNGRLRGYGVGAAGGETVVERHFAPRLIGENAREPERLWEELAGARGAAPAATMHALSAVDLALWDLPGREPEWERFSRAVVLTAPCGPGEGRDGMLRNVAAVERLRASAGPVAAIALDARMGWTERYTVEMAAMLILHRVAWIEDCLPPREYRALARISRQVHPVRLAAGSCEHALDSFERMLEHGSVRVWRPDVHRCGGLTGLRRIAALAEAHGIEVSPRTAQMSYRRA